MNAEYPTIDAPATPDFILAVLRDMHRQQCQFDPVADRNAVLTHQSTIEEWRAACDLVGCRELGQAHNEIWGINCSEAEWMEVLEPAYHRTLADVCKLIAERVVHPEIRDVQLMGKHCKTAGAFLTIRSMLHKAGAQVSDIAPSTPLAEYARKYYEVFLGPVSRLAPGALPLVRINKPLYDIAVWGMLASMICLLIGSISSQHALSFTGVALYGLCYPLTWFSASCMLPTSVEFGNLRTFRDLSAVVADTVQSLSPPHSPGDCPLPA